MGVTIQYRGKIEDLGRIDEAISFAEVRAAKLGWGFKRIEPDGGKRRGALLLPHHHCEVVSVLFDLETGDLAEMEGDADQVFTRTQFTDFATHASVCRFLRELGNRFIRDLQVTDETGYFESGRPESFRDSADAARVAMNAMYTKWVRETGRAFELGPFRFVAPAPDRLWRRDGFDVHAEEEFGIVPLSVRDFVVTCDRSLHEAVTAEGMVLDATFESVESVESLLAVFDGGPMTEEREAFINLAAAYVGRALCEYLGGVWTHSREDGLCVSNLGGTGLSFNPFDVLAARGEWGPVHGIQMHFSSMSAEVARLQALLAVS